VLDRMRDEVTHRGPDDSGLRLFADGQPVSSATTSRWHVGLGHRRLSILDLSPAGAQPMAYGDRFWIIYNGEVYNYIEVRAELERLGHSFRSTSDTEVILAAYAEWGVACFARLRGMWAIVIFDRSRKEVVVSRDRLGIKPLYLWRGSGLLALVSEIKQLRHVPGFTPRIDTQTAVEYLATGYEDSERSFFRGVQPIKPGCWLRIPLATLKPEEPQAYWHPEKIQVSVTDASEAGTLIAEKLRECVRIHLRSDVPVGCALSGGLDSSAITVLANSLKNGNGQPLHTFTFTSPGDPIDERDYADAVVARISAESHFVTMNVDTFLTDLDAFVWTHDEPVGCLSMYAAYCLARLTRKSGVSVTLNGQGGDEVFSGYWQSYFLHLRELWKHGHLLDLADHVFGAAYANGNPALLGQVPVMLRRYQARRKPPLPVKFHRGEQAAAADSSVLNQVLQLDGQSRRIYEMRRLFLPRLLKWDDRNFMAFSVESRYPFLDHELIELCLSFSPDTLYQRGWTKFPLRLGLSGALPPAVRDRRSKFGFETPRDRWLCGPLRPTLQRWLTSDRPIWDHVERKSVQQLADRIWGGAAKGDERGQALFRMFVFDRWLSVCGAQV
jgi:asparagine synthase (glutamine-hydrolysing)